METHEVDDYDDVLPEILSNCYGVHGRVRRVDEAAGAGASDNDASSSDEGGQDESDDESESRNDAVGAGRSRIHTDAASIAVDQADDFEAQILDAQQEEIAHTPIEVPHNNSPFGTIEEEELFLEALMAAEVQEIIPRGYGVHADEIEKDGYPTEYTIKVGFRTQKTLRVELPYSIWYPRALKWARALETIDAMRALGNDS